jgi:mannose-6-phosphate isomerase-like protein (cupin superfamily)
LRFVAVPIDHAGARGHCTRVRQRIGAVMPNAASPRVIASSLTELWSPRVIAEVDDAYIKVAKVHGSLAWHSHDSEDELFLILKGRLRIEMEDGNVELDEGEMFVVPKGVRHNPVAEQECLLMLIERKTTQHTGDVVTEKTRSLAEQLRPLRESQP